MQDLDLGPDLVERVRGAVLRHARHTPLLRSERLSSLLGGDVFLKCENLQVTGSFKLRGAVAALALLSAVDRARGVWAASAGNHGLGLAWASRAMGISCRVVVPSGAPDVKVRGMEDLGAQVERSPYAGYDDTLVWALSTAPACGGRFVSAFEDPAVAAGNGGTVMREILEDLPSTAMVVAPCGGGGLVSGLGVVSGERVRVIGVNSDASPGMWLSRREGRARLRIESEPTIAEGIEGGVGTRSFAWAESWVHEIVLAREATIRRAVAEIAFHERLVVEGAGAAGVAALLDGAILEPRFPLCVVLTGSNIDPGRFHVLMAEWIAVGGGAQEHK